MFSTRTRGALAPLLTLGAFAAALGGDGAGWKDGWDGSWAVVSAVVDGRPLPADERALMRFTFRGDRVSYSFLDTREGTFKMDRAKRPGHFDMRLAGQRTLVGIYRPDKDRLTLCFSESGERPKQFRCRVGYPDTLLVLRRVPAGTGPADGAEARAAKERIRQRVADRMNFKMLILALHTYHDTYKRLPNDGITDKRGKPLLSWRVAILPFIEALNVYQQFKRDEPWDSPHNKKLLAQMPAIYAPVRGKTKEPYTTHYQAIAGPQSAFEPNARLRFPVSFPDGLSDTIFFVEASEAVPWTKPADVPYDPKKELPRFGGQFPDGFHIAMGDASVLWVGRGFDPATFRAAISRNGGEKVDFEKLSPLK